MANCFTVTMDSMFNRIFEDWDVFIEENDAIMVVKIQAISAICMATDVFIVLRLTIPILAPRRENVISFNILTFGLGVTGTIVPIRRCS